MTIIMEIKTEKKTEPGSWALPGNPITLEEFKAGIKEAEKGPFYTASEAKKIIDEWRRKRNFSSFIE